MIKNSEHFEVNIEHFDSISSMLNACDTRAVRFDRGRGNRPSGGDGYRDYKTEREDFVRGVTADVKSLQGEKIKAVASIRPQKVRRPVGYFPLVPRAVSNVPNCMRAKKGAPSNIKVVHLLVSCSYPWHIPPAEVAERGRELVAFIRASERAGYSIGVDVIASFAEPNERHADAVTLTLKKAERALDIKRLCYPLLHAGFLRQICFDWYERHPQSVHKLGYGVSPHLWDNAQRRAEFIHLITDNNTRYIDLMKTPITEQLLHGGE